MKKKIAIALVATALVLSFAIGGTLAWLIDKTDPVTNIFTYGDINITLKETTTGYKMVPGNIIKKDPKVTVEAGSEACWLFVLIEKNTTYDQYLKDYIVADGWTKLGNASAVYYREVSTSANDQEFKVLKDDQVKVKESVTKQMMANIKNDTTVAPTLTFTAYAVQKDNVTSADQAWKIIESSPTETTLAN